MPLLITVNLSTHVSVPSESEPDPSILLPSSSFRDSLDIGLLLEYFGILGHIFRRVERIKVANVGLVVEHGDERCSHLSKALEGHLPVEFERLDLVNGGNSVLRGSDQAALGQGQYRNSCLCSNQCRHT